MDIIQIIKSWQNGWITDEELDLQANNILNREMSVR